MQGQPEILRCPKCGEVLIKQEYGFWKCPLCDGEWWPPDPGENERVQKRQILECWLEDMRIPLIKKHRSSSKSGRKRGRKPWKPLLTERYLLT